MLDQILTNPALRFLVCAIAGILLVAIVWGGAIIWRVEARYRAQRRADQIAAQMRTGRDLRGMR
ncbi:MAG TPA: hypothetical protein PKO15_12720 [Fibrobacteria bacterium]|nr:hypothetical protein [Fibrobacteria bacterium]